MLGVFSGGWHGSLSRRGRSEDETAVWLAVGEGSPAVCSSGGCQARTWGRGVRRPRLLVRSEDDSAGPEGVGRTGGFGGWPSPKKRGGRRPLTDTCPALLAN